MSKPEDTTFGTYICPHCAGEMPAMFKRRHAKVCKRVGQRPPVVEYHGDTHAPSTLEAFDRIAAQTEAARNGMLR